MPRRGRPVSYTHLDVYKRQVLERILSLPPGVQVPGRIGAFRYTQELVTHAWDLAAAVGRVDQLDPALAEPVIIGAQQFVPRDAREGFPLSLIHI